MRFIFIFAFGVLSNECGSVEAKLASALLVLPVLRCVRWPGIVIAGHEVRAFGALAEGGHGDVFGNNVPPCVKVCQSL